jgi:hypothetical protein
VIPPRGRWVFITGETEFHVHDGVCVAVFCRGGFWGAHTAVRARLVGVVGPGEARPLGPRRGDALIFARAGQVYLTGPVKKLYAKRPRR